ncbi:MAG: hypothetical protein AAFV80_21065, partial [Bacteroidota bacterium]
MKVLKKSLIRTLPNIGLLLICCFSTTLIFGQAEKRKTQFFPLPALSFSPETGFTFGLATFAYADLAKGDTTARMSNFQLLSIYTTKSQLLIDGRWFIYTKGEQWAFTGRAFYHFFPDRNYGYGNDALGEVNLLVGEEQTPERLNYLPFNTQRFHFAPVIWKKVRPSLFAGIQFEYERLFNFSLQDELVSASNDIQNLPIIGARTGL